MHRIRAFVDKYYDIVTYLFFGGLTTLVNFCVYFPLFNWVKLSATVSNIIAWVVAVVFAFLTNKPFVFRSHDWSQKTVIPELTKFIGCRIGSGLLETAVMWLFVDVMIFDGNWMKVILSIFVVVLNYISSKVFVFKRKD